MISIKNLCVLDVRASSDVSRGAGIGAYIGCLPLRCLDESQDIIFWIIMYRIRFISLLRASRVTQPQNSRYFVSRMKVWMHALRDRPDVNYIRGEFNPRKSMLLNVVLDFSFSRYLNHQKPANKIHQCLHKVINTLNLTSVSKSWLARAPSLFPFSLSHVCPNIVHAYNNKFTT